LEDSLLNQEKARALTEMQIRFETEEKERALQEANENAILQERLLNNQKIVIWSLGFGLLLVVAILFLLYRLSRLRKREKEAVQWRMREQHHRIENNISVLASVLSLAGQSTQNEEAKSLAKEGENRLNAMNLLHKELYWEDNKAQVQLHTFIASLAHHLAGVFWSPSQTNNPLQTDLQPVQIEVERAIPLSLILNELITNAFKYGASNPDPQIIVSLLKDELSMKITVRDNGMGISEKQKSTQSFGHTLINTLTKQLKGRLEVKSSTNGTTFTLKIPS
ncbi:MAG: sensor histidine kinase, partial [Marinoscillum sp.]